VYVLVLGTGLLLAVVGLSLLTLARLNSRTIVWANDSKEARVLAEAAVEWALTTLAADAHWRTTYTSGQETPPVALGHGALSFKLVDEIDGDLANGPTDAVRLYGLGRTGAALRIYSVELVPDGPALDVLKTVAHAGGNLTTAQTISGIRGPLSANGTLTVPAPATVDGDVEAPVLSIAGTVTGVSKTVAAKVMPPSSVFAEYLALATDIPYASVGSGTIQSVLLSPATNPYGSVNPKGVYHIRVPVHSGLSIRRSRLVATLLITLEDQATLSTSTAWLMEPPQPDAPTLLIRCLGSNATVNLDGSTNQLSESSAGVNFNPPGTPYPWPSGVTDSDLTDNYRPRFVGLLHVICPSTVTVSLATAFNACGTILTEGPLTVGGSSLLRTDLSLYANPPIGYRLAGPMVPVAGSWRWEKEVLRAPGGS